VRIISCPGVHDAAINAMMQNQATGLKAAFMKAEI
jgi:hypothetical protein